MHLLLSKQGSPLKCYAIRFKRYTKAQNMQGQHSKDKLQHNYILYIELGHSIIRLVLLKLLHYLQFEIPCF